MRFFDVPTETAPGALPQAPRSPWTDAFGAGTRISTGLSLALDVIRKEQLTNPAVLLVSDLDDDSGDIDRVSQTAIAYRRAGIPLHVVGLNAAPEDVAFIRRFVTGKGSFEQAALPSERSSGSSGSDRPGARRSRGARRPRPRRLPPAGRAAALESLVSAWRIVLGVGAVVLGLAALAFAHDIRAWHGGVERGDARFAARPAAARWEAGTWLPGDPALAALSIRGRPRGSPRGAGVRRRDGCSDGI